MLLMVVVVMLVVVVVMVGAVPVLFPAFALFSGTPPRLLRHPYFDLNVRILASVAVAARRRRETHFQMFVRPLTVHGDLENNRRGVGRIGG